MTKQSFTSRGCPRGVAGSVPSGSAIRYRDCCRFRTALNILDDNLLACPEPHDSVMNRDMAQVMYVHRSCKPLTQIEFQPRVNAKESQLGFGLECEGVCGV